MMKSRHSRIYIYMTMCMSLAAGSCIDDAIVGNAPDGHYGNTICFDVTSGFGGEMPETRSLDCDADSDGLAPVMLSDGKDTLYLHRYVAQEVERATGRSAQAETRSAQVNTVGDFKSVNGESGFLVTGMFTDGTTTPYIPNLSKAVPMTPATTGEEADVWHVERQRYYWPDRRELRFNAIAPASAVTDRLVKNPDPEKEKIDLGKEEITFDYTVPTYTDGEEARRDAEKQPDIMLASTVCTHDGTDTENHSDLAPLNFRHALSAIKFAVRDIANGEIVDISIKGVAGSGKCTFNTDPDVENPFTWLLDNDSKTDYTQTFNYTTTDPYPNIPDLKNATVIDMPEKTFMLIPQSIPDDAKLEITFKSGDKIKTLSGDLKTTDIPKWEAGKEYIYTISTSSENWTYVFNVLGNEAEGYGNIYVYSPNDDKFAEPQNTGYYSVESYRFRTNNPSQKQILPWTATFLGSESYKLQSVNEAESDIEYNGKYITAAKWISDQDKENNPLYELDGVEEGKKKGQFKGIGSYTAEKRNLDFYPHYLVTDWEGDEEMQNTAPFSDHSETNPYDLSTFGSGNKDDRSTANCYVVDRPGWYCLPLVYGNAIINGKTNSSGYTSVATNESILRKFYDYERKQISGAYITDGENGETATLLWEDAYNMISNVSLRKVKKTNGEEEMMLCFAVNRDNLQQGNAIVALLDKNNVIMWSWHIWATEHWLGSDGKPQILSSNSGGFDASLIIPKTGIRKRGDATVTQNQQGHTFYMSPYNLGWCDPKNVIYLKRKSRMDFVQYMQDNVTETKRTAVLDIIQQGEIVNYKIGNNTYYQWGRKDPLVGFVDRKKNFKTNFGPFDFDMEKGNCYPIEYSIKNPHLMLATNSIGTDNYQNWTTDRYINLWNNSSAIGLDVSSTLSDDFWSHTKTVYDPCPVGYVVPNAGVWMVLGYADRNQPWDSGNASTETIFDNSINGERGQEIDAEPRGIMPYIIYGTRKDDKNGYIYLIPTGNRWYSDKHDLTIDEVSEANQEIVLSAGLNFNLRMFYSWSNRMKSEHAGLTGAIGIDGAKNRYYVLTPQFNGRCAMGRPIRAIRDPNFSAPVGEN